MSLGGSAESRPRRRRSPTPTAHGVLSIAAAGNDGNSGFVPGRLRVGRVGRGGRRERRRSRLLAAEHGRRARGAGRRRALDGALGGNRHADCGLDHVERRRHRRRGADARASARLVDGGQCTAAGRGAARSCLPARHQLLRREGANVKGGGGAAAVIYNNVESDSSCGDFAGTLNGTTHDSGHHVELRRRRGGARPLGPDRYGRQPVGGHASGYEAWDGTSMATPHVSAVAALVWSCNPSLTNAGGAERARQYGKRGWEPQAGTQATDTVWCRRRLHTTVSLHPVGMLTARSSNSTFERIAGTFLPAIHPFPLRKYYNALSNSGEVVRRQGILERVKSIVALGGSGTFSGPRRQGQRSHIAVAARQSHNLGFNRRKTGRARQRQLDAGDYDRCDDAVWNVHADDYGGAVR